MQTPEVASTVVRVTSVNMPYQPSDIPLTDPLHKFESAKVGAAMKNRLEQFTRKSSLTWKNSNTFLDSHSLMFLSEPLSDFQSDGLMSKLPLSVITKILNFLDITDLCRLSVVSKDWKVVSADSEIWKHQFKLHFPSVHEKTKVVLWKDLFIQQCKNIAVLTSVVLLGMSLLECENRYNLIPSLKEYEIDRTQWLIKLLVMSEINLHFLLHRTFDHL